ncbi:MAG: hypothetical protein EHM18_00150 [Acidobacteria bacterium]|nr:MAG: hypothetical protein EHM18_00150 [Acidobacteriota bacterium]
MRIVGATKIYVLSPIDTTYEGPKVPLGEEQEWQPVHLRQGSLDGACGPYSVMMALIICGVANYEDARTLWDEDHRTRLGKLLRCWDTYGPLCRSGAGLWDLINSVSEAYGKVLESDFTTGDPGPETRGFIEKHVNENHAVILRVTFSGGSHWVVVVGLEYGMKEGEPVLWRYLVLDPAEETPTVSAWNGVIGARSSPGPYPYRWWTAQLRMVTLSEAFALWAKKQ